MWKAILMPILLVLIVLDMAFFQFAFKAMRGFGGLIYILILIVFFESYAFQALQIVTPSKWARLGYIFVNLLLYAAFIYLFVSSSFSRSMGKIQASLIILTLFLLPKLFLCFPLILEDFYRLGDLLFQKLTAHKGDSLALPSRRKFVSISAWGLAAFVFSNVLYGVIFGKYRFRVIRKKVFFDDLPDAFDGFTITQISDIHAGSFDNPEKVAYGVDMINQQQSDIIVFTGDMVNNSFEEMLPYRDIFGKLAAKDGMFSVFGNHDYGGYGGMSKAEQENSKSELRRIQREIGFDFLSNEHRSISRNGQQLHIVGVENWGASRHFPKMGDLAKATEGLSGDSFKVLLSHDPSHFDFKEMELHPRNENDPNYNKNEKPIIDFEKKVQLTLSGHTHGMQFGIEIPGFIKFSPVSFRYPKWAGLYEEKGRKLYVNRGFGYLAFPGRVGIWPEITVLELCKSNSKSV